ncbi:MAG: DUF4386 domain-containing protein [Chloroflexi bacterium]|nr:DUF4386 domain-containing protein [Chloroflexota bacterium]
MTNRIAETSPLFYARVAGVGYLFIFVFGFLANFLGIVPGDATTTAGNIMASESLFRMGIASWLIVLVADAVVAWALYVLLVPGNRSLSLLAAWFRLVFVAIFSINMLYLLIAMQFIRGADNTQAMLFLNTYDFGTNIAFIFFGIHIFVLGYLIYKSGYIPRILGVFLIVASVGYLIDSFASVLSSSYANNEIAFWLIVAVPAIISELSITLWLLIKGVNVERWNERALESV